MRSPLSSGKSAFINTVLSTFSSRLRPSSVVLSQGTNLGSESHVTFAVQRLRLPSTRINLIDVWGLRTGDEKYTRFLTELVEGRIKDGAKESEWEQEKNQRVHPKQHHRIHVCIYVLRRTSVEDGIFVKTFQQHQDLLQSLGVDVVVLMTAADEVLGPGISVMHSYSHDSVLTALADVQRKLHLGSMSNLLPATLYTSQRTRNKVIELMAMAPLLKAVGVARRKQAQRIARSQVAIPAAAAQAQRQPDAPNAANHQELNHLALLSDDLRGD
jgi:hypothetical protein